MDLKRTNDVLLKVRAESDSVLLFHSATGKDSIVLADLCSKHFNKVICVFMYTVKGLEHVEKYIALTQKMYKNISFIQVPHYALSSAIKYGSLGIKKDSKQRLLKLSDINRAVCEKTGINWTIIGFKQNDSMNRRLMLKTYEFESINYQQKKAYPLSHLTNADCLAYINMFNLPPAIKYGTGKSQGAHPGDIDFLLWLKNNYPTDLQLVFEQFPLAERILFEHEQRIIQTK